MHYNHNKNKPFIINLEVVASWLKTGKKDIKDTLINTYKINKDYIFSGNNPKNNIKQKI